MPGKANMKPFFEAAIENVHRHGDTDIFPYPIENHILCDKRDHVIRLLRTSYAHFDKCFTQFSPSHINTLVPVGQNGFRLATQQDPYWNAFLLGLTLSLGKEIEAARIPVGKNSVFSYRLASEISNGSLFRDDVNWRNFVSHSIALAKQHRAVVLCDIADCYQRVYHHRLDNALRQLRARSAASRQIMEILGNFSNTKSYGLPVGGPSARILVELVLNMTDQLLKAYQVPFCRYADDYHIFVNGENEAYDKLIFLSEKLLRNDGLSIQKSKTRIMSSDEFVATQQLLVTPEEDTSSDVTNLFSLKLRYDPYSDTRDEDYETLKNELSKIDVLGLLNAELTKTRIHGAITKRLISAVRHLRPTVMGNAVLTILDNLASLYPIFPVVAVTLKSCFQDLSPDAQDRVCSVIREKIVSNDYLLRTELHSAFAARILSEQKTSDNEDALVTLHSRFQGPLVRRDVILIMAKWAEFHWLSDQINEYPGVSAWERRAFIIASFKMGEAGAHWRNHMKEKFDPFEVVVRDWAAERVQQTPSWEVPI